MNNDTAKTSTRPRIVARNPDDHPASVADSDAEFQYFVMDGPERLKAVKTKIEEREKVLFDLELVEIMLEGNPEPGECRKGTFLPDGKTPYPCQCGNCELARIRNMKSGIIYALGKLRALYSRLS